MSETQPPADTPTTVTGAPVTTPPDPPTNPPKRHRRPSVRLGELGDQTTYETIKKPDKWKHSKTSKTRQLETINTWNITNPSKPKKGFLTTSTKRIRSNWLSKNDNIDANIVNGNGNDEEMYDYDDVDRYTDNSLNVSNDHDHDDDEIRVRVSDSSDLDRNGVKVWLNQLGLSRYFSIFEVHEVDDEVLPLLTLEDLKDMGINAVGSRRKMFSSIQKLGKGFS